MFSALLIVGLLLAGEETERTGIITGAVVAQPQQKISDTVHVILLPPPYVQLWNTEVQKRLDQYWQQYLPVFKNQKELFSEFSKRAHHDATSYVLTRMQRDPSNRISEFQTKTSFDGTFEFKNVPFGEYRILALGKIGNQDVMWHEFIDVQSAIPHFLELKTRIP